ncbi:MAG: EamA family transporter [Proteobacteria bacterium]|nr:MAG: EamA family transporter [Pseudomonadota bacterium]
MTIFFFKNINKGVLLMLLASFFSACMGGFAKALSENMDTLEVVFFRNVVGVVLVLLTIIKKPLIQEGGHFFLLVFRGFIGFIALLAWFYNVSQIPLADAVTFANTSPIFTALFAYLFLNERIGWLGWFAIFLGFFGLVFIVKPNGLSMSYTDILGIFSGLGAGLAYTSIRELKKYYDTRAIVLSFMLSGTIFPILFAFIPQNFQIEPLRFMFGEFIFPSAYQWFLIAGLGIFATLMQTFMTLAYGATKAGIVSSVSYMNIVFSIFIGMALGDSFPDILSIFGIILIISGGILIGKENK